MSELIIRGLSAAAGRRTVVSGVEFRVAPGTMTALVGVNGVGKSTLLRAIAGLQGVRLGQVCFGGQDLHRFSPKKRAQLLSFVGQEETIQEDLTLGEMVRLGRLPFAGPLGFGGADDERIVHRVLTTVGLTKLEHTPCGQLSGGQRRLALIARGLAQETPVVLLDEPTNHLDPHHRLHLLKILRESGRGVIASIHDLDVAFTHFDQVVVLHDGIQYAVGNPQSTLTPQTVREVFGVHTELIRGERLHLVIDSLCQT